MRHNKKKGLKLGTDASHTKAMKKSLAKALFENDRIKTTATRAKALRSYAEPIVTWAKKGDLHSRRLAIAKLGDKNLVAEIFDKAAQGVWADRNGGYTRIMKLGTRKGDNAEMVIIELVTEPVVKKAPRRLPPPRRSRPRSRPSRRRRSRRPSRLPPRSPLSSTAVRLSACTREGRVQRPSFYFAYIGSRSGGARDRT